MTFSHIYVGKRIDIRAVADLCLSVWVHVNMCASVHTCVCVCVWGGRAGCVCACVRACLTRPIYVCDMPHS